MFQPLQPQPEQQQPQSSNGDNNNSPTHRFFFKDVDWVFARELKYLFPAFDHDDVEYHAIKILQMAFDTENINIKDENGNDWNIMNLAVSRSPLTTIDSSKLLSNDNYFRAVGSSYRTLASIFHCLFEDYDSC